MKKILGAMRKAITDFDLIQDGDIIAVGVSGGKDSLILLHALSKFRSFSPQRYELRAVTVSLGLEPFDLTAIKGFIRSLDIPYTVVDTDIGQLVFNDRKEKNPCALCAKMRHGVLHKTAKQLGCNKIALGHNSDDVVGSFLMSLFYERRLHTFAPSTYLDRRDLTMIRPLIYLKESYIAKTAAAEHLPVLKSPCPVDGSTKRAEMREITAALEKLVPGAGDRILTAIKNTDQYKLW